MHMKIVKMGIEGDPLIGNTLIDMYAKRSFLDDALSVFNAMTESSTMTLLGAMSISTKSCAMGIFVLQHSF